MPSSNIAWNPGKVIIIIALIVAFVATFIPWVEVAKSQVGNITINGWGSVTKNGTVITKDNPAEGTDVLVKIVMIPTFLVALALGVFAIKRDSSIKKKFMLIVGIPFCLVLWSLAGIGGEISSIGTILYGWRLFFISIFVVLLGILYSNIVVGKKS